MSETEQVACSAVDFVLMRMDIYKAATSLVRSGPNGENATTEDVLSVAEFLSADLGCAAPPE